MPMNKQSLLKTKEDYEKEIEKIEPWVAALEANADLLSMEAKEVNNGT